MLSFERRLGDVDSGNSSLETELVGEYSLVRSFGSVVEPPPFSCVGLEAVGVDGFVVLGDDGTLDRFKTRVLLLLLLPFDFVVESSLELVVVVDEVSLTRFEGGELPVGVVGVDDAEFGGCTTRRLLLLLELDDEDVVVDSLAFTGFDDELLLVKISFLDFKVFDESFDPFVVELLVVDEVVVDVEFVVV